MLLLAGCAQEPRACRLSDLAGVWRLKVAEFESAVPQFWTLTVRDDMGWAHHPTDRSTNQDLRVRTIRTFGDSVSFLMVDSVPPVPASTYHMRGQCERNGIVSGEYALTPNFGIPRVGAWQMRRVAAETGRPASPEPFQPPERRTPEGPVVIGTYLRPQQGPQWLVVVAVGGLFAGAFLLFRSLLLRFIARADRAGATAIPSDWLPIIQRDVPAVRGLAGHQRERLLESVQELVETRRWEGCGGLTLSTQMKLVIAAQASLLTLALPGAPYPHLRSILVYPQTFVPRRLLDARKWLPSSVAEEEMPELGEAWADGTIVLAWDSALAGAHLSDGHNVVYHEFAHELAFEKHLIPNLSRVQATVADPSTWQRVLQESYEQFCRDVESGAPAVLDEYGVTNLGEFFAVATETFFVNPSALRDAYPELYTQLRTLYRQDPAQGDGRGRWTT
jgi:Mlc titration factor MtfA (ptsG expression regulator)